VYKINKNWVLFLLGLDSEAIWLILLLKMYVYMRFQAEKKDILKDIKETQTELKKDNYKWKINSPLPRCLLIFLNLHILLRNKCDFSRFLNIKTSPKRSQFIWS